MTTQTTNTTIDQVSEESRFVSEILYIEINKIDSIVSGPFGNVVVSINMFKTPL